MKVIVTCLLLLALTYVSYGLDGTRFLVTGICDGAERPTSITMTVPKGECLDKTTMRCTGNETFWIQEFEDDECKKPRGRAVEEKVHPCNSPYGEYAYCSDKVPSPTPFCHFLTFLPGKNCKGNANVISTMSLDVCEDNGFAYMQLSKNDTHYWITHYDVYGCIDDGIVEDVGKLNSCDSEEAVVCFDK